MSLLKPRNGIALAPDLRNFLSHASWFERSARGVIGLLRSTSRTCIFTNQQQKLKKRSPVIFRSCHNVVQQSPDQDTLSPATYRSVIKISFLSTDCHTILLMLVLII